MNDEQQKTGHYVACLWWS